MRRTTRIICGTIAVLLGVGGAQSAQASTTNVMRSPLCAENKSTDALCSSQTFDETLRFPEREISLRNQLENKQSARSTGPRIRVATYRLDLTASRPGQAVRELSTPSSELAQRAQRAAEVIKRSGADVVVLTGLDTGSTGVGKALKSRLPAKYAYSYDGTVSNGAKESKRAQDPLNRSSFPGQNEMLVLSSLPMDTAKIRSFSALRWKDMPGASLPDNLRTPAPGDYFPSGVLKDLPLASGQMWSIPVRRGNHNVNVVAVNAPGVEANAAQDSPQMLRHQDEMKFLKDLVTGGRSSEYIYDDAGNRGGLATSQPYVLTGFLGADPYDSGPASSAVKSLAEDSLFAQQTPSSEGGREANDVQGGINEKHRGDPAEDTADFSDAERGNLRLDYVLPSSQLKVEDKGVYWPRIGHPGYEFVQLPGSKSTNHRLVWMDLS